ncbi:MAG: NUDIX domain-containing protein [Candidatus Bathyarchaeota archaeon]|nr:NUDIX domain-containing protein [Candidatus Bathyarchaeota archaeon]
MLRENSCGAVVFFKNPNLNYLLLHYEQGHWGFVKGNVEFNESEKTTVIRELEEETGIIAAKFIKGFREKVTYVYVRHGKPVFKQVIFFLIETHSKEVSLSFEHIDFKWVQFLDAMKFLTFNNSKNVLKKADYFLKTREFI